MISIAPRRFHQALASSVSDYDDVSVSASSSAESPHAWNEQLGITTEQAEWLNQHRHTQFSSTQVRLKGLAELISCSPTQAASMVIKEPSLLDVCSKSIQNRLKELNSALGGEARRTNRIVRRMPALLAFDFPRQRRSLSSDLNTNDTHFYHLDRLASLFCDDHGTDAESRARERAAVRELCFDEPLLLAMPYEDVLQRLENLSRALHSHGYMGSHSDVARHCLSAPWMLTTSTENIDRKLRSLSSALHLSRSQTLDLALSYPKLLTLSEDKMRSKVEGLCDRGSPLSLSPQSLQYMVRQEPSFLMRSTEKVKAGLRTMKITFESRSQTGTPGQSSSSPASAKLLVADLVKRRAAILTRNESNIIRCYDSLSIWQMSSKEKEEIFRAHPSLLRLCYRELHARCRWLRNLILSNGFYHSALRRISGSHIGVIILHLPKSWSRLQYLAESNLESRILIMDAVHLGDRAFESQFPDYKRWLSFKRNEIGGTVPWRRNVAGARAQRVAESDVISAQGPSDGEPGSESRKIVLEPTSYYYGRKLILNRPRRTIQVSI